MEKGWCSLVPQLLESTEHDYREKVRMSIDCGQLQCYRNSVWNDLILIAVAVFLSGSPGSVGHGSNVFGPVPLRQFSAGVPGASPRPVPGYGPVRDHSGGAEQLLHRDGWTFTCTANQNKNKMTRGVTTVCRGVHRLMDMQQPQSDKRLRTRGRLWFIKHRLK